MPHLLSLVALQNWVEPKRNFSSKDVLVQHCVFPLPNPKESFLAEITNSTLSYFVNVTLPQREMFYKATLQALVGVL